MVKMKNWVKHPTSLAIDLDAARASRERQAKRLAEEDAPKHKKSRKQRRKDATRADIPTFFSSKEWLEVRYKVLKRDGAKCVCCGATPKTGAVMNVDHIKPRWKYPELSLDMNNLQVLCSKCNAGKGGHDKTDWRKRK